MSAGVSKLRAIRPVLVAAILLSCFQVINREFGLPAVREQLTYNAQDLSGKMGRNMHPRYDGQTMIYVGGKRTFRKERAIESPQLRLPAELESWGKRVVAQKAVFVNKADDRPMGYLLTGVTEPQDLKEIATSNLNGRPTLLSPRDHSWLKADECFLVSDLDFEQLTGDTSWRRLLSTWDLIRGIQNRSLNYGADIQVLVHSRFLQPLMDATMLLLGLPFMLGRETKNVLFQAQKCLIMVAVFVVATIAFHSAGSAYLIAPTLATWAPLLVFAPLGITWFAAVDR